MPAALRRREIIVFAPEGPPSVDQGGSPGDRGSRYSPMLNAETAWAPYSPSADNPWDRKKVGHLYRRAAFGATIAELARGVADGPEKTLAHLLDGAMESEDFTRTSDF